MNAVPDFLLTGSRVSGEIGAVSCSEPDAELVLACAQFVDVERRVRALYDGPAAIEDDDAADAAMCRLEGSVDALLTRMEQLRAATTLGIQARAAALAEHNSGFEFSFDDRETVAGRLLDWLMRDALALALAACGVPIGLGNMTEAELSLTNAGSINQYVE